MPIRAAIVPVVLVAALAVPSPPAVATTARPDRARLERRLDAWAAPFVEAGHLAGQLLVSERGAIVLERSWGYANREHRVPVTPATRFNIASITKPMTVMIAQQLMQERKLGYGDTLRKWLPDFPNGDRITIEHLLRHRTGIPHRVTDDVEETLPRTAADMVTLAARKPLRFTPGEKSEYSSGGFSVLARVLELAGGKPYGVLLEDVLFGPLGMRHSSDVSGRVVLADRAASYVPSLAGFENAPLKDLSFLVGAGSVTSTARDLHVLLQAVVSGRLGEAARLSWVRSGKLNWNGSTNGFRAFASWDSASGVAIVYAGNVHTGAPDRLREALPALLAGEALPPSAVPDPAAMRVTISDAELRATEGVYTMSTGTVLEVRAREGALWANDWALVPVGKDAYHSLRDYGDVRVVRRRDGTIERLDWTVSGGTLPAPRTGDLPD
jgi:CubicO group peptidase (beta-lactamase class C family)